MKIVIATHNTKKRRELEQILAPLNFTVINFELSEVQETGATFEENAKLKAENGCRESGHPCIGDDSGLCVDALDGAPGIYSARFAGEHDDDANTKKLLKSMKDKPKNQRTARYVCAICMVFPDERSVIVRGECEGRIAFAPVGEGGFGYDPVFLPDAAPGFTMAQLHSDKKHMLSHRGDALQKLAERLKEFV
ncbi:MAG: RdgB/HAM1 family non-canonical purine NTP pyrophosphatase [Oscillospiraceae bacterium]|jgi:XTP/dITP diphosphohydrolase|nr:RdgB/HAM1 family non-canonical purine NTP pyrophosphatase [Oscillospiraceae bacterium]